MNFTPQIPLKFDGRGSRIYYPGETLAGSYYLNELGDEAIDAVEISVLWHTEGKGNEDFGIHQFWRRSVANGDWIDIRTPGRFHTILPNSPLSYDGEFIKIFWSVRIRVFMTDGREIMDEHPFRLGNTANIRTLRLTHQKWDASSDSEKKGETASPEGKDDEKNRSEATAESASLPPTVSENGGTKNQDVVVEPSIENAPAKLEEAR